MLPEPLDNRAASYVSGAMTASERESFELLMECHGPLRARVAALQEVSAALVCAHLPAAPEPAPAASLKEKLFHALAAHPRPTAPDAIVVTDATGRVEWINAAFTEMCGYTLAEVKGRKPGAVLQGPATDPAAVCRMRDAVRDNRPCHETLVNYRKSGETYRVDIHMAPIMDDEDRPLYFVAREKDLGPATGSAG